MTLVSGSSCVPIGSTGEFNCTTDSISAGETKRFVVIAYVSQTTNVSSTVYVSDYSPDNVTTNNDMMVSITPVDPYADVSVTTYLVDEVKDQIQTIPQNTLGYIRFALRNLGPHSAHYLILDITLDNFMARQVQNFSVPGCIKPPAGSNIARCNITMLEHKEDTEVDVGIIFTTAGELPYIYNLTHMFGDLDTDNSDGNDTVKVTRAQIQYKPRVVEEEESGSTVTELGIGSGVLVVFGAIAVKMGLFKRKRPVKKDDGITDHLEEMERMDGVANLNEEEEAAMEDAGDIWVDKSEVTLDSEGSGSMSTMDANTTLAK
jgi:hypothetical protein